MSSDESVFSHAEWNELRSVVSAGYAADAAGFKAGLKALGSRFPRSRRSVAYLWFSLRYGIAKKLGGRRPTEEDLGILADELANKFNALVISDQDVLRGIFGLVFDFEPTVEATRGANFIVNGSAALAVVMDDLNLLDVVEKQLPDWYNEHGQSFSVLAPREG